MDALVMCGGRGTRLGSHLEKPLVPVGGRPTVDRVVDALGASAVDAVYAVPSPATPATAAHCSVPSVETPGEGYVADLQAARSDERIAVPVLTVAADLPLLSPSVVDDVLDAHGGGSLTVAVPAGLRRDMGVSVGSTFERDGRELAPTGLNVVGGDPAETLVVEDRRLAVNVNRPADLAVARRMVRDDAEANGR